MSDEKRDTPTSSLTQAGDIVDTFWDIKPIEFPRLDGDEETSTLPPQDGSDTTTPFGELPVFSGPDQTDESTTESASTMQALMTSRPTWWHNQSSRNAR